MLLFSIKKFQESVGAFQIVQNFHEPALYLHRCRREERYFKAFDVAKADVDNGSTMAEAHERCYFTSDTSFLKSTLQRWIEYEKPSIVKERRGLFKIRLLSRRALKEQEEQEVLLRVSNTYLWKGFIISQEVNLTGNVVRDST